MMQRRFLANMRATTPKSDQAVQPGPPPWSRKRGAPSPISMRWNSRPATDSFRPSGAGPGSRFIMIVPSIGGGCGGCAGRMARPGSRLARDRVTTVEQPAPLDQRHVRAVQPLGRRVGLLHHPMILARELAVETPADAQPRSEGHKSELQSLMRI